MTQELYIIFYSIYYLINVIYITKSTNYYNKWIKYVEVRSFNVLRYYISNHKLIDEVWDIKVNFFRWINDKLNNLIYTYLQSILTISSTNC